jgi:hypothetical protein
VSYLYEQGFPPLGHLHTGNIFLVAERGGKEVCKVAGYENTILGYRTGQGVFAHQRYSDAIDLRMFGEMRIISTLTALGWGHAYLYTGADYSLISSTFTHKLTPTMLSPTHNLTMVSPSLVPRPLPLKNGRGGGSGQIFGLC